jgi:hypothetical protein
MDGAWISADAGVSWERHADGLDGMVLEQDPLQYGLPEDIDPRALGLFAVGFIPGDDMGMVAGSANGLYVTDSLGGPWSLVEGTSGRIEQVSVSSDGMRVVYATADNVFEIDLN